MLHLILNDFVLKPLVEAQEQRHLCWHVWDRGAGMWPVGHNGVFGWEVLTGVRRAFLRGVDQHGMSEESRRGRSDGGGSEDAHLAGRWILNAALVTRERVTRARD